MTRILTDPSPSSQHWQHRNQPQDWPHYRPSDHDLKIVMPGQFCTVAVFLHLLYFPFSKPRQYFADESQDTQSRDQASPLSPSNCQHNCNRNYLIAIIIISLLLQLSKLSLQSKWLPLTSFMQTQEALGEMLGDLLVHSCIRWLRNGNAESFI